MPSIITRLWILVGFILVDAIMCFLFPDVIGNWVSLALCVFCLLWILTRPFHRW
ncbi:MAG TPA: hypothetical protein VH164_01150 [Ktedonobacteraceae bacterium]|jgi:hypothetical protein|nr:hypothetical protein [Ktedonobacteraceae bacterium]